MTNDILEIDDGSFDSEVLQSDKPVQLTLVPGIHLHGRIYRKEAYCFIKAIRQQHATWLIVAA